MSDKFTVTMPSGETWTPTFVQSLDDTKCIGCGRCFKVCPRGVLELASSDASVAARFDGGFLSEQDDVDTLVRGVQLARKIIRAPSLSKLISEELAPSTKVDMTRDEVEAYVRSRAKTVYHPAGTCRMGDVAHDAMAVVDTRLRVSGVARLRVADASIMPTLVSGNTNAPTVKIAERSAHILLAPA